MSLEKITHVSQEEAEDGIVFLDNGLPKGALPMGGKEFPGYYSFVREISEKKVKLVYEPFGRSFLLRNAFYLD